MVIDRMERARLYGGLGAAFGKAFAWLATADVGALATGTYEIDGRDVYAIVQEYRTKRPADGAWEAHRRYIDLQYVVTGIERIGFAPAGRMAAGHYDDARDFETLDGEGEFLTLRAGDFMVLWPGEAHMPGMATAEPAAVRKIVVKIAVE